jgi:uncharacterized protein YdbL (DUF1318 family)
MKPMNLQELITIRIAAKRAEDAAIAERRRIDASIAALLKDPAKLEGSISQRLDGFKVTVTYKVDRKADTDKLSADWAKLSAGAQAAFRWKADVSVSELKKLTGKDAAAVAAYITSKDASPSITIEAV